MLNIAAPPQGATLAPYTLTTPYPEISMQPPSYPKTFELNLLNRIELDGTGNNGCRYTRSPPTPESNRALYNGHHYTPRPPTLELN